MSAHAADRKAVEQFLNATFVYADPNTFVSLRAFEDTREDGRAIFTEGVRLDSRRVLDRACARIAEAASHPTPVVFCPPVATFKRPSGATTNDLANGVALSVECDEHPREAREKLESVLGRATVVVGSGGDWANPETGEAEPKLHLHWRLTEPTRETADHQLLREARRLATALVGGDATAISIVHPLRWPGSWHRKKVPARLARIVSLTENEIDLGDALERLREAAPAGGDRAEGANGANGFSFGFGSDDQKYQADILDVTAALAVIPNGDLHWDEWNRIGMAAWLASSGRAFAAFDAWSRKSSKYDPQATAARWEHYGRSPPTGIGAGTLFFLAAQAAPGWRKPSSFAGATEDASQAWNNPDLSLLGTGRRPAPDFPVDRLGPYWSAWALRRARAASAPVDYVGVALLAGVSAMIANVRWPVAGASWSEPPVLWCAEVGSPSSGKSPSQDAAFDLVRYAEERMATGFDSDRLAYETTKATAKAKRDAWEAEVKAAVKAGGSAPQFPAEAEAPEPPVRPRIRVADATIEALGALAAALPRGLLLVRDELSGWLGAFDKYGGGGADRAFAIEMYGGRSYVVDRVKHPEPIRIEHLSIGVLGGVQPDKLSAIIEGPDDGLASRLLWTWPDAIPAFALAREVADDADACAAFTRLTTLSMGSDAFGKPEPKRIRLCPDAENLLEKFGREMAERAHDAAGLFAGSLGKARGHALRLAAVLEFLWWCGVKGGAEPATISATAMASAAGLLDGYFIPMAERVYGDAAIPVVERGAMLLVRYLRKNGLAAFNAREARRAIGGQLREAAALEAACAVLVEAGLIRPQFSRAGDAGGRRARNYDVNPAVFGGER